MMIPLYMVFCTSSVHAPEQAVFCNIESPKIDVEKVTMIGLGLGSMGVRPGRQLGIQL